jgi:Xaa-Pro aminopeptidase
MSTSQAKGSDTDRVERLAGELSGLGVDALLVQSLIDVRYLSGFSGSSAMVLVMADSERQRLGPDRFMTDFRYVSQAAAQVPDVFQREIVPGELLDALPRLLAGASGRLGFDDTQMTVHAHRHLRELLPSDWELVPCTPVVRRLRAIKDEGEVGKIATACQIADAALTATLAEGLVGRTEVEVAVALEQHMRTLGAEAASFPSIVASGAHGALPHAQPRPEPIPPDVLVTIDWGARHEGYCSDCTRTFATGENIGSQARSVYELVLAAQEAGLEALMAGPNGVQVDSVAREIIDAGGHGSHFGHGLGHGVGLEIHEGPRLSRSAGDEPLKAGNIVTIEPGVYIPGELGVRIEDLTVVRDGGQDVLTNLPKELAVVG